MPIGLGARRRRAVSLEEGAGPEAPRCPACGEPLFIWVENVGRCENCGLAVAHDVVPTRDQAAGELLAESEQRGGRIAVRVANAASLQAWLGAEHWAALGPETGRIKPTPRAAKLLLASRGLDVRRVRQLARPGMASMWQTLLNLLTFHRDFASAAVSGRLRPGAGRSRAAFWIDAVVTVLAAVPTALLAVLLEGGAVIARRGGVIELQAQRLPTTD